MSDDVWTLPHEWSGAGQRQAVSRRTVDFLKVLPEGWVTTDVGSREAIRRIKRIAALMFTQTIMLAKQMRGPPKPSTWVALNHNVIKAASSALQVPAVVPGHSGCPDGRPIFRHLDPEELKAAFQANKLGSACAIPRLNGLLKAGQLDDWPASDVHIKDVRNREVWQPFEDDFVALSGNAAMWMAEQLGPDVLVGWTKIRELRSEPIATSNPLKAKEQRAAYARDWANGMKITCPVLRYKFQVSIARHDGTRSGWLESWDEVVPHTLEGLAAILQESHFWIVSLACGPRNGELVSFPRDCLRLTANGPLLRGWTFKLSDSSEPRDWPIPKAAVKAVKQQQQLAELLDPGGDRLFVSFKLGAGRRSERDKLRFNAHAFSDRTSTADGRRLTDLCQGNVHSHRFRKTVARLAALSLVGASDILFDVFGHRDPDMTLAYILSDPELQDEMRQVSAEAAMMIAADAIKRIDGSGGPAAPAVRELVARYMASSAETELGENSIATVAQLLSQDGRVMLVKRNVLCTKTLNQAGPCNRRTGNPDIGNCQISCVHRLELAAARQDHRLALERALVGYEKADGMMRSWWQGQISGHLLPFPDFAAEALKDPRVRDALEGIDVSHLLIEETGRVLNGNQLGSHT
ncbi:hypothetical protein [Sphingomonas xinjiangensis]|uniref:Tyr recombinase domain-containing protein n=1 Tax=Sphingomonas xinjiangensis TaxID=643568 RepID=A0A840YTN2_9SPHN|nr:hypothetical protein [Sphingomonas xinjiangensis]MBB5713079.1 hypothetical protein [Sphingomonas xinjiangensis]